MMTERSLFFRTNRAIDWTGWDALIKRQGITLDRPKYTRHPVYPDIVYPIDYGFVNGTMGGDGDEIDIFVGSAPPILVALIHTADLRKGDREVKLLYGCSPEEIYLVHGFINFAPELMQGRLTLRHPMAAWWEAVAGPAPG
jgi:hypothetical protein